MTSSLSRAMTLLLLAATPFALLSGLSACKVQNGAETLAANPEVQRIYTACLECHRKPETDLHEDLRDAAKLEVLTPWLGKDQLESMLGRTRIEETAKQQFRDYVKVEQQKQTQSQFSRSLTQCFPGEKPGRLAAEAIEADSSPIASELSIAIRAQSVAHYSKQTMPKVWQTSTATNGYFDAAGTNFATTMTEDRRPNTFHDLELGYFGVGTMEFPWLHSAGLDVASGADSVKFVIAPANGLMQTNVRSRTNSPDYFEGVTSSNVNGPQLGWEYQPGTIFGEEIYRSLGTHRILLEVRLRRLITRIGRQGVWKMDVLRHFGSKAELDQAVQEFCRAGHPECKTVQPSAPKQLRRSDILNAAAILRTEQRQQPQLMHEPDALNALAPGALMQTANVGPADEISPALFAELTKQRKLKSVFGRRWLGGDTDPQASWAPFATSENSYIPKNYLGAFLPLTMKSCMHCHSSAGHHVNQFDKKPGSAVKPAAQDAQAFRTWYHFLQGNDTVFTYHPIATAAVTTKTQLFSSTEGPVNPGAVDSCKVGARSSAPAPTSPLAGATTTLPSTPFPTPTPPQGPAPFSIARGQQLWQQSCATSGCHTQKVAASAWTNIASGTNASQTMRSVLSRLRLSAEQIEDLRNFLNARD